LIASGDLSLSKTVCGSNVAAFASAENQPRIMSNTPKPGPYRMSNTPKIALTRNEAAKALGLSGATLDRLTKQGLLVPNRATRRPLYPLWELDRFLLETSKPEFKREKLSKP
jgi:hypothetical protein